MLVGTEKGRRRLFRPGDPCHPLRVAGKNIPHVEDIPPVYRDLLDWCQCQYASRTDRRESNPVLALRGLGKDIRTDESADAYVRRLRNGWQ